MAERGRSPDSGGTTAAAAAYNTLYIDTNIDTHFGLIISHSETISDLKDQIVLEHGRFFPEIGVVKVHGVKVKWNEIFYYLPDYMLVKNAFEGDTKRWFLSVDVSKSNDVLEIVRHGASNLLAHDHGHLHDDSFKIPRDVDRVQAADVQNGSSSKREYNIPASNHKFKDDNVPNDVSNLGSYSSGRSVETCNSSKKLKRKHNSLQATSISKEMNMSSQALCGNKLHFETGNTTVNKQINKAGKLLGSHGEFEPQRDGQETSSCNVEKSKQNRKGSLLVHEQAPSSLNSPKCVQVNDVTVPASICSPGIHNLLHDIMPKMDHMDKTVERTLYSLHDSEVNCTGELNFALDGLEKPGESAHPSALSDTKEVNVHKKRSKKRARSSKPKFLDDHDDQVRNLTAESHLVFPDSTDLELPAKSEKGRLFSGKHDVTALGPLGSSAINHMHNDMLKVDSLNKTQEKKLSTVDDPEMRRTEELDLLHCKSTVPSGLLVIKEVKTHENSRKKRSKISRSGVPDEHVDRPGLEVVAASDHHCCESTIVEGNCSSKADVRVVEKNRFTITVDTDEGTEGVKRDGEEKKIKVQKSGAGAKDQENRESTVSENDLNLEHVPEKGLSTTSDCLDVPKALEVNEATEDGNAIDEKKKKQKADEAVATVQDTGDINRDANQLNDVRDVEKNLLTKTVDTDEGTVNCGGKKKKKKVRKAGAGAKDQQNCESIVAENDLNLEQVPETQLSSNSDCPDVPKALEVNEATEDGKATDGNKKKQKAVATVQDTGDMNRDADQPNYVRAVEQNPLSKTVVTDEATEGIDCGGKKKKKKVRKSGAGTKDRQNQESIVAENYLNLEQVPETQLSSNSDYPDVPEALEVNEAMEDWKATYENKKKQKAEKAVARVKDTGDMNREADQINDIRDVEQNLTTRCVDTDTTEGVNCGGDKKKKKVQKSGAVAKDRENQESIVAENDLNLEQVPEKGMSTNSNCPDVLKALEVNEVTEDGKAIEEKKEKAETVVAEVQDTDDMYRDADQINDTVPPSVAFPKPDDLMPPIEHDETYQKIEERDQLVNNDFEKMVLSRDVPSNRDQNEPVIEIVSNTNTSTATVAEGQKMSGTRIKKRARKTVSAACQDGMDSEKTETRTRSSSKGCNSHADVQVEKDKDLLPPSKRIDASATISSDTSRGKSTPPMESPLNQVSAELGNQKDGEVSECIGKDINFKQYFVPIHPQDEVTSEQSANSLAKKKRKEVIPSAPKLQQDFPVSTEKVSIISSAGKANDLAESNRVTKTKKKTGKRGVPYATTSSDLDEFRTPTKPVSSAFLNCSDATKTVPRKRETAKSLAASGVNSSSKTFGKPPLKSNTRGRKESSLRPDVTTGRNPFSKLDREVVIKSREEKSLGQPPKSIFRDGSSESSLGENGSVDSSASTGTPSDLSSSSDLSEDAATNGRDGKAKGGVKKSVPNSEISGQKHIPIGTILRSSSRFKKAKVTASQQFEDPDN